MREYYAGVPSLSGVTTQDSHPNRDEHKTPELNEFLPKHANKVEEGKFSKLTVN